MTANYFQILGGPLALGRAFTPKEERPGADARRRDHQPSALAATRRRPRTCSAGPCASTASPFTVVGVAAEGFTGTGIPGPEVWLPLGARRCRLDARDCARAGESIGRRLRAGVPVETVAPALATVARRLEQAFPEVNAGYTLPVAAPSRLLFMPGPGSGAVTAMLALLLMVMPAIVLLVACLNLADLLLARGHVRRQELAIRSSLGGGRGRITRQLLTEGLLLALAGGAVGLLLSTWATSALLASVRPVLPAPWAFRNSISTGACSPEPWRSAWWRRWSSAPGRPGS